MIITLHLILNIMKDYIKVLALIIPILFCSQAKADLPGIAHQYDQYSQNEKVYFKSVPFYWLDLTDFGKTAVFDSQTDQLLYKIENYMPVGSFISNNGKTIISVIDWIGQDEPEKEDVLNFFINGKKVKTFTIGSFMKEKLTLTYTTSHAYWYKRIFMSNDTLFIQTLDEQAILLDGNSGHVLKIADEELITQKFDLENLPSARRVIHENIKYPMRDSFPDLVKGNSFKKSLLNFLNRLETQSYDSATNTLNISVTIDRAGNAEIFYLSSSAKSRNKNLVNEKIKAWVIKQKFQPYLIPLNADKWVFEMYLYLL